MMLARTLGRTEALVGLGVNRRQLQAILGVQVIIRGNKIIVPRAPGMGPLADRFSQSGLSQIYRINDLPVWPLGPGRLLQWKADRDHELRKLDPDPEPLFFF